MAHHKTAIEIELYMSSMTFEFSTAGRIVFGSGAIERLGEIASESGRHVFIITGLKSLKTSGALHHIEDALSKAGLKWSLYDRIKGEPDIALIDRVARGA